MGSTNPARSRVLVAVSMFSTAISVVWAMAWLIQALWWADWIPFINLLVQAFFLLLFVSGSVLLILFIILPLVGLIRRSFSLWLLVPLLVMLSTYLASQGIPDKLAVTFRSHRQEFVDVIAEARVDYAADGQARIPARPFYESAILHRIGDDGVAVEFIVGSFYKPLVFVSSDRPEEVMDACSKGGAPIERLEEGWYICLRDWN